MHKPLLALTLLAALTATANAETVDVKYSTAADLSTLDCTDTVSSFVHRVCYAPSEARVIVQLKSVYYAYCDVPADVVADWLGANSKGRFYNANIKGQYPCPR